jgi:hypothetical protein
VTETEAICKSVQAESNSQIFTRILRWLGSAVTGAYLQKEVNSINQRLNIAIEKVKEPYRQPNILAEYIAFQLKK